MSVQCSRRSTVLGRSWSVVGVSDNRRCLRFSFFCIDSIRARFTSLLLRLSAPLSEAKLSSCEFWSRLSRRGAQCVPVRVTLLACHELSSLCIIPSSRVLAAFPKVNLHWPQAAKYQLCPVFMGKVFKWNGNFLPQTSCNRE